jgi:hypothetical protein
MVKSDDKYYTPTIEEFHVGFEYEMKATFGDGTVKTKQQFDAMPWEPRICSTGSLPYIERALYGKNAENGLCGIRVKYLDRQDIEECGLENAVSERLFYIDHPEIKSHSNEYFLNDEIVAFGDYEMIFNATNLYCVIRDYHREGIFKGIIRNKSELKKTMQMLQIPNK